MIKQNRSNYPGALPSIRTTKSNVELRSSLAADCAVPMGVNAGGTGLTANCVPKEDVPFLPLCLRIWKFFSSPFASSKSVDDLVA